MPLRGNMLLKTLSKGLVVAPFVYDGLQARLAESLGFGAVYLTGFGTAARLGMPDVGLVTLSEMSENVRVVANSVQIPVIADADTGYGNPLNVMRTVREYRAAGAAALHIEDQIWPKRCGFMQKKQVIPLDEMTHKLKAALDARADTDLLIIARTDALESEGWNGAEDRARAYAETGADLIFVDGIRSKADLTEYAGRLGDLPLLFNNLLLVQMKSLHEFGFKLVIHPGSQIASFAAMRDALKSLRDHGDVPVDGALDVFNEILEVLGAEHYLNMDKQYSNSK
jgi:2-methylisocitrate lyase-like PEP mutase family enzyme